MVRFEILDLASYRQRENNICFYGVEYSMATNVQMLLQTLLSLA